MNACRTLASALLFLAPLALAQTSERVTVSLVEVPVTVVDGSGNPVRGLTAENFQISDDRGKRALASFEAIDFATAGAKIETAARRNFLLLFDLSTASRNKLNRAQKAARAFVTAQAHPSDLFAVGTIDAERGFRMVTAFTSDRALIGEALDDPLTFIAADPLGVGSAANQLKPVAVRDAMSVSSGFM
jgi:VWFA-related protein